jgi:hypothetical protein
MVEMNGFIHAMLTGDEPSGERIRVSRAANLLGVDRRRVEAAQCDLVSTAAGEVSDLGMSLTYSQVVLLAVVLAPASLFAAPSQESLAREYEQVRKIAMRDPKVRAAYAAADQRLDEKIVKIDPDAVELRQIARRFRGSRDGEPCTGEDSSREASAGQACRADAPRWIACGIEGRHAIVDRFKVPRERRRDPEGQSYPGRAQTSSRPDIDHPEGDRRREGDPFRTQGAGIGRSTVVSEPPGTERGTRLRELAVLFLKLGVIGFGGPAAHIAMMEDEVVRRRQWLSREEFLDLLGATNLIPGPNSTEMAIHIGRIRRVCQGCSLPESVSSSQRCSW